jgi:ABC-type nickel/cobalt efflux system permease component RcnA
MLVLGLLLVVLSGAVGVLLIAYNNGGDAQTVTMFGRDLGDVTMAQAFIAGLVVAAVFLIGLAMIMSAGRRARENRARYREARKEAKAAARERDELAQQLRKEEDHRNETAMAGNHQTVAGNRETVASNTDTMVTPPAGTPVGHDTRMGAPAADTTPPRHAAPPQQPVITNIKPGDSPTR